MPTIALDVMRTYLSCMSQLRMAEIIPSTRVRRLNDDGPDTIGGNALHHDRKTRARRDVVCPAYRLIIVAVTIL